MKRHIAPRKATAACKSVVLSAFILFPILAAAQTPTAPNPPSSTEERLRRLEQRQQQLEDELRQKDAEIQQLKNAQAQPAAGAAAAPSVAVESKTETPTAEQPNLPAPSTPAQAGAVNPPPSPKWGRYTQGLGFTVADTDMGSMNISPYTYLRYVNQKSLDSTYTNAFGTTSTLQKRDDVYLNKAMIKLLGWAIDPNLRYLLYTWTNNTAGGTGQSVVVAGNLNYTFNKYFILGGGVDGLPGARTVEGNFPNWLSVDNRQIADEFFRPSYTYGIWARGQITDTLRYRFMVGNNLSALGVSSAQLNNKFNTVATALIWEPTADYGNGYGDFEYHESISTRLAAHFTHSTEDKQSQPNTDAFSNTQIRLSDGTVVFTPNIFGPGITVTQLAFFMEDVDFGLKYKGWSLEGEYYVRQLNGFEGPGTSGLRQVDNNGFQVWLSDMVIPKTLQLYLGGSKIYGDYGNPYDTRLGVNWFPFKFKGVRWNTQVIYLDKSPVGNSTLPYALGAKGVTFNTDFEVAL
ncbi:MAG TPA: hypothetical protein VN754_06740 [Candidatus Binataceae bacterium]|nr:hypothetical protein [Candidatus Binataceae bacterium]